MDSASLIQVIIQGGAVGLAALAMWTSYKLASNHLNHLTAAVGELTKVLSRLEQLINDRIK